MSGLAVSLGRVVTTLGVNTEISRWGSDVVDFVNACVHRHQTGDWGDLDPDDTAANDHASVLGERVLSAYALPDRVAAKAGRSTLWIITETDRASTTILWPEEY